MPFSVAISGLNATTTDLGVIANNIANTNTTGFKRSRAEFSDVYAVTNLGTAQNQSGSGVRVAAVTQQFTQGGITFTDNNLDLAISGSGYFRLSDNGAAVYSRAGAFGVDSNGYVVNTASQRLTGFLADATGNITGAVGDLRVSTANLPPLATTAVDIGANIDGSEPILPAFAVGPTGPDSATFNHLTSTTVYDSLGTSHVSSMYFRKNAVNEWQSFLFVDGVQVDGPDLLQFTNGGILNTINGVAVTTTTSPPFNPGGGAANMVLTVDYTDLTQFGSIFGVSALSQNGFSAGRLSAVDFDETGVLFARFTNGRSSALGQVTLAGFANEQGLRPLGDNVWAESFDSGVALLGAPGSSDLGFIESGALEDSNVDLTAELVKLITAQRNFQANTQVITTADAITQSIINIR